MFPQQALHFPRFSLMNTIENAVFRNGNTTFKGNFMMKAILDTLKPIYLTLVILVATG
jgi:hypothetical protein